MGLYAGDVWREMDVEGICLPDAACPPDGVPNKPEEDGQHPVAGAGDFEEWPQPDGDPVRVLTFGELAHFGRSSQQEKAKRKPQAAGLAGCQHGGMSMLERAMKWARIQHALRRSPLNLFGCA